jgi:hypothetical protein
MKKSLLMATCVALALVLGLAAGAWAGGPDKVTLTDIQTDPTSTINGKNVNVGTVQGGADITLKFTVGTNGNGTGSTDYTTGGGDTVHITTSSIPSGVSVDGLSDCKFTSYSDTFKETATITAPAATSVAVSYQVTIAANDGRTSNKQLIPDFFFVNFTVAAASSCTPANTSLILSKPDCVLYHATSVSLSATLKNSDTNTALVGKTITFYVDANEVGTAVTGDNGVATLTYDPSSLKVGDHPLTAAWTSDDPCLNNPDITGSTLGIQYLFMGFQPPINANGSTILTGKCGPVKIIILDANGVPVPDATALVYFADGIQAIVGTDTTNVATGLNFDSGNVMRYSDGQYVYNWDLSTTTNGTKTIQVYLGEGSCAAAHTVVVSVGKKGK